MKTKTIEAWAGIVSGKIDSGWLKDEDYRDKLFGIFKTRKEARKHYEGVRKVEIKLLAK